MPTLLAKKADSEKPVATDDEAHAQLVADPHVDTNSFADPHAPVQMSPTFGSFNAGAGITGANPVVTNSFGGTTLGNSMSGGFGSSPMPGMQNNMMQQQQPQQQNLTAGAEAAVKGGAESTIENTSTDWINKKWRPVMGWI